MTFCDASVMLYQLSYGATQLGAREFVGLNFSNERNLHSFAYSPHFKYMRLERFSIESRKTKTKVITLANQKGRRQSSKPIKTRSNYT